jgi:hypothetical protein
MAALVLGLLRWAERPSPARLGMVATMAALGLAHHLAMTLLLPAAAFFVLASAPRQALRPRALAALALGGLLGLSPYLYLPLRYLAQPAFNYAGVYDAGLRFVPVNLLTWEGFTWLVTGRAFAGQMFAYRGTELWLETRNFLILLGQAFFAVGIGPGLLGAAVLGRRNWRQAGLLLGMFGVNAAFYIGYRVVDKATMYLPAYLVWALWAGVGCQALLAAVARAGPRQAARRQRLALAALMAGTVALAVAWNWRLVDLSSDWSARRRGETILRELAPNAVLFGWWDTVPVIQYLQLVEGQRPDVLAVNRFLISPEAMRQAIGREVMLRPVYIDRTASTLDLEVQFVRAGPVYRLAPRALNPARPDPNGPDTDGR